jgi:sterol desaturase/sphingolipid hydroxylase (fatty acid hydroxylase superfamily)
VSIAAEYAHPVEFAICNHYPLFAGSFILRKKMHFTTFVLWGTFRVCETHEAHSGYDFPAPISLMLGNVFKMIPPFLGITTDSPYHDYHHSKNVGNYSSFIVLWDSVLGSNQSYYEKRRQDEITKSKNSEYEEN